MLNLAVLMGRLTSEPELKHTPNDVSVCSFTLAVDRSYVKSGQDRQADFVDIVAWRGTADFVSRYFHKGQLVAVQGSIQTRSYTDKNGDKRKAFEVVADNVHFAEKKDNNSQGGNTYQNKADVDPIPAYANDTGDFEEMPSDDDFPF